MDCFHYVTYGIFALWFSLNEMFDIKFSISLSTLVERTRLSHVFIEVYVRQKTLKRATGHLSPPTNGQHKRLDIPVVMLENLYLCSFNA